MKKLFKKYLAVIMVVVLTLTAAPLSGFVGLDLPSLFDFKAEAETKIPSCPYKADNPYPYYNCSNSIVHCHFSIKNGEAVVSVGGSKSGALSIPSTYYGYPVTSVTYISNEENITSITIPGSVTGVVRCSGCPNLTSVTIADGATCSVSCSDCPNLTNAKIGNGVTGVYFAGCTSLTSITTGSVTGEVYCHDCPNLTSVTIANGATCSVRCYGCPNLTNAKIGNGVTGIFFADCTSLTSVTIPDSVTDIFFAGCTSLTSVTIPDGVTDIYYNAFEDCRNLENITIPNSLETIYDRAFKNCVSLKSITIPNSVEYIGANAFDGCSSLRSVVIPGSVFRVDVDAFANCDNLTKAIIENGVEYLDPGVFSNCKKLEYVHIPQSAYIYYDSNYTNSIIAGSDNAYICSTSISIFTDVGQYANTYDIPIKRCNGQHKADEPTEEPTDKPYKIHGREFKHNLDYFAKNGDSSKYDPELANMLAALSAAVYKESDIREAYEALGFDNCEVYDYDGGFNPHSAGYALAFKQTETGETICLVTVRGTNNTSDWIGNIDTRNIPGIDSGKHPGFSQPANRIYDNIQNYIDSNNITGDVKYYVTGHSRGAAVGNLLSVKLMENDVASSDVYNYNYATPDVAAKVTFTKYDNIFNICNREDVVPHVPGIAEDTLVPDIPGTSWGKYGQTHWFTKDAPGINPIDNHDMNLYLDFMDEQTPPSEWKKTLGDSVHDAGYTASGWLGKVLCPVDVIITDKNGNKIASVIDGETNYYDSKLGNVIILTDGDKKVIYINGDNDFNVNLVGTDTGEMTYSVEKYNIFTEETLESKTFENVKLEKGKEMQSAVCGDKTADDVSLYVYENNDGDKTAKYAVNTDGSEIEISEVFKNFAIKQPSVTTVKYGDTLVLSASIGDYSIPAGYAIEWLVEGAGVSTSVSEDGLECRVTSIANGNAVISAKIVSENGEAISNADGEAISNEITVTSKGGFFWKFISFFKNLFRMNRVIY